MIEREDLMDYEYTRHQVARGTKPDFESATELYLIKGTSYLRLTYQIRLLTYLAFDRNKKLIIEVPSHCLIGDDLISFINKFAHLIKIRRT